ncbi:unnamed protein product, partial [Pleuronectes platessa]
IYTELVNPRHCSSFSITPCPCAGHQMTSSPPEELSSFFISAAAWLSPGQQPATQGEGTSACLRIRDRLGSPSVCQALRLDPARRRSAPSLLFCGGRRDLICGIVCAILVRKTGGDRGKCREGMIGNRNIPAYNNKPCVCIFVINFICVRGCYQSRDGTAVENLIPRVHSEKRGTVNDPVRLTAGQQPRPYEPRRTTTPPGLSRR